MICRDLLISNQPDQNTKNINMYLNEKFSIIIIPKHVAHGKSLGKPQLFDTAIQEVEISTICPETWLFGWGSDTSFYCIFIFVQ